MRPWPGCGHIATMAQWKRPSSFRFRYFSLPSLRWAKACVAGLCMFDRDVAAFLLPASWGKKHYVVRARNNELVRAAWSGFVQAYIARPHGGYGEVMHRLPPGSRQVFPRPR